MIVIDASVWMSFLIQQDAHHAATHPWLTQLLTPQQLIAAPIILLSEIGGAISRRTGRIDLAEKAVDRLLTIPTLRLVTIDRQLGLASSRLAARYRLRGADALYVALAEEIDAPLVSWDQEQLTRAAGQISAFTPSTAP